MVRIVFFRWPELAGLGCAELTSAEAIAAIVSITQNQSYTTIDTPFSWWLPLPSLSVLSLFTTLSRNQAVGRRLARKTTSINTGVQPGPLADPYGVFKPAGGPAPRSPRIIDGVAPSPVVQSPAETRK